MTVEELLKIEREYDENLTFQPVINKGIMMENSREVHIRMTQHSASRDRNNLIGKRSASLVSSVEMEKSIANSIVPRKQITLKASEKHLSDKLDKELNKSLEALFKLENPSQATLDQD